MIMQKYITNISKLIKTESFADIHNTDEEDSSHF